MALYSKLLFSLATTALAAFATTVSFPGPTTINGVPCDPADPQCVIGGTPYDIFGAQLTAPSAGNPNWTLTIEMNYPTPITGNTIPTAQDGTNLQQYSTADFLISWGGHDYGIVLAQHINAGNTVDSYVAGSLYQAPNVTPDFVPSGQNTTIFGTTGIIPDSPRPNFPIWLAPGGTLLGTGTITIAQNGNGTPAQYTITDSFSAPAGFLANGPISVTDSSWVCANGIIVGTGTFDTPEPSTSLLFPTALLLLPFLRRKLKAARV